MPQFPLQLPRRVSDPSTHEKALRKRWRAFSFPLQYVADEHLKLFGVHAAQHLTGALERALGITSPPNSTQHGTKETERE